VPASLFSLLNTKIMARIIYGALAESIRGSIGGTTFQKNAYGYTIKKKPNMIHPNSEWQQAQKIIFSKAVLAWSNLTTAQRLDWDSWASTYPQYAKNNPSSQLSGFAVFVRQHCLRFLDNLAIDTNPTYVTYPAAAASFIFRVSGAAMEWDFTDTNGDEDYWVAISLSRPFAGSQNFIGTRPRYFDMESSISTTHHSITAKWLAKYGTLPIVGQQIAWRAVYFGNNNGQVLAAQSGLQTIVALV
jgi:hypothetical protein